MRNYIKYWELLSLEKQNYILNNKLTDDILKLNNFELLENEIFVRINDTEHHYYSNKNRIVSVYKGKIKENYVKFKNKNGYIQITFSDDGKQYFTYEHILVADLFLPDFKGTLKEISHVHHCDRDRANNSIDNLIRLPKTWHEKLHTIKLLEYRDCNDISTIISNPLDLLILLPKVKLKNIIFPNADKRRKKPKKRYNSYIYSFKNAELKYKFVGKKKRKKKNKKAKSLKKIA